MPKCRWTTVCECCKSPILVGSQFTVLYGRKWIPAHADHYLAQRKKKAPTS